MNAEWIREPALTNVLCAFIPSCCLWMSENKVYLFQYNMHNTIIMRDRCFQWNVAVNNKQLFSELLVSKVQHTPLILLDIDKAKGFWSKL